MLFNSVAAFAELQAEDAEAAEVLLHPKVLRRTASIPGVQSFNDGPCFAYDSDSTLITRFSDGSTETWTAPEDSGDALERALKFLRSEAESNPKRRIALSLKPSQTLIFRNDLLSHGREEYKDVPDNPRHLIRALYEGIPTC